jgi:hypothetical protein
MRRHVPEDGNVQISTVSTPPPPQFLTPCYPFRKHHLGSQSMEPAGYTLIYMCAPCNFHLTVTRILMCYRMKCADITVRAAYLFPINTFCHSVCLFRANGMRKWFRERNVCFMCFGPRIFHYHHHHHHSRNEIGYSGCTVYIEWWDD